MREQYRIRVDTYCPGGRIESEVLSLKFASLASAGSTCDDMQRQYDYDCQAVTVWVIDQGDVPRYRVRGFNPPDEYDRPEREPRRLRQGGLRD